MFPPPNSSIGDNYSGYTAEQNEKGGYMDFKDTAVDSFHLGEVEHDEPDDIPSIWDLQDNFCEIPCPALVEMDHEITQQSPYHLFHECYSNRSSGIHKRYVNSQILPPEEIDTFQNGIVVDVLTEYPPHTANRITYSNAVFSNSDESKVPDKVTTVPTHCIPFRFQLKPQNGVTHSGHIQTSSNHGKHSSDSNEDSIEDSIGDRINDSNDHAYTEGNQENNNSGMQNKVNTKKRKKIHQHEDIEEKSPPRNQALPTAGVDLPLFPEIDIAVTTDMNLEEELATYISNPDFVVTPEVNTAFIMSLVKSSGLIPPEDIIKTAPSPRKKKGKIDKPNNLAKREYHSRYKRGFLRKVFKNDTIQRIVKCVYCYIWDKDCERKDSEMSKKEYLCKLSRLLQRLLEKPLMTTAIVKWNLQNYVRSRDKIRDDEKPLIELWCTTKSVADIAKLLKPPRTDDVVRNYLTHNNMECVKGSKKQYPIDHSQFLSTYVESEDYRAFSRNCFPFVLAAKRFLDEWKQANANEIGDAMGSESTEEEAFP